MKNKAISPLIASILLIVFTVVVAGIISILVKVNFPVPAKQTNETNKTPINNWKCIENATFTNQSIGEWFIATEHVYKIHCEVSDSFGMGHQVTL